MQRMIWPWKAWTNAKRFGMYYFSQFFTVLSQFRKWWKTYFHRIFYKLYRNDANNIPLKSYGKCETLSYWQFSLISSRFQVISKMARSFILSLSRNRFTKNASCEVPELSVWNLELHSVFHVLFFLVYLYPLLLALHPLTGIEQVIYRWKAAVNTQLPVLIIFSYSQRF